MAKQENDFLGTAPIGKLMLKLIVPTLTAQLVNLLYNIVDRIYVGHLEGIGVDALAGIGIVFPITMIISAFAQLITAGGASMAAIAMGGADKNKAEKILANAMILLIASALVLTVLVGAGKEKIVYLFGASSVTAGYAIDYLSIYLIGTVFVLFTLGMNNFITCQGFTFYSMITVCIGAILNIILDALFIYGLDMGVKGAALATIIGQSISALWVILFFSGKKTTLRIHAENLPIDWKMQKKVLLLGLSPFVMTTSDCIVQLLFNRSMQQYGGDLYVSVMSIMFSLLQFIWLPLQGFAQGAQPITSFNFGAGNMDRVRKTFKRLLVLSIGYSATVSLAIEVFPGLFIRIFNSNASILAEGIPLLRIFFAAMAIMGAQCACQQTFLALGEARVSLCLALLRKAALQIPLVLILPGLFGLGVYGVCMAESIADLVAVSITCLVFRSKTKKIFKISIDK